MVWCGRELHWSTLDVSLQGTKNQSKEKSERQDNTTVLTRNAKATYHHRWIVPLLVSAGRIRIDAVIDDLQRRQTNSLHGAKVGIPEPACLKTKEVSKGVHTNKTAEEENSELNLFETNNKLICPQTQQLLYGYIFFPYKQRFVLFLCAFVALKVK